MPSTRVRKPTVRGAEYKRSLRVSPHCGGFSTTQIDDNRDKDVSTVENNTVAWKRITIRWCRSKSGRVRFLPPTSASVCASASASASSSTSASISPRSHSTATSVSPPLARSRRRATSPDVVIPKHLIEHHRRMGASAIVTKDRNKDTVKLGTHPQPWHRYIGDGNCGLKGKELKEETALWAAVGIDFPFTK